MKKLKKTLSNAPGAWIVSSKDRGRKSIKNGKVYLNNKEIFEIELFNPLKKSVLAKIKLNGSYISTSGLILNPGERVYLDCYIDDRRKFVFSTYSIDGNNEQALEAIQQNGLLEVFFYRENTIDWTQLTGNSTVTINPPYPNTYPYWYVTTTTDSIGTFTTSNVNYSQPITSTNNTYYYSNDIPVNLTSSLTKSFSEPLKKSKSLETGKVVKGEKSKQNFEYVNMDFESFCFSSVTIQLLPESRKPIYSSDLKKNKKESNEVFSLIEKLAELYDKGVLTEQEFSNKKADLLSKI
jgi:hypothetical protein